MTGLFSRLLGAMAVLGLFASPALADTKISALPTVSSLAGPEQVPVVQGGVTKSATAAQISALSVVPNGLSNLGPTSLPKWRKAVGRVRTGGGDAVLLMVGDSTTHGTGAGTSNAATWAASPSGNSVAARLAQLLAAGGLPANASWSAMGTGGDGRVNARAFDPRVTYPTDWTDSSFNTLAGLAINTGSSSTGTETIAFPDPCDTVVFKTVQASGQGTLSINLNGGTGAAAATVNANNATGAILSTTLTNTRGLQTLNITRSSASNLIIGAYCRDSTTSTVRIINGGWGGKTTADIGGTAATQYAWSYANGITDLAPDLTIINMGINDAAQAVSAATMQANLQVAVTRALASGDVILVIPYPQATTSAQNASYNTPQAQQDAIATAVYAVSAANGNLPVIDMRVRFPDWPTSSTAGFMSDGFHMNSLGYADVAQLYSNVLLRR